MLNYFLNLDRRWVFLVMGLSVAIPILLESKFPEKASGLAENVFVEIEALKEGDKILLAFDFDPASEGELAPMATAFVRHCCEKKLKMYFMALWPVGEQMIVDNIAKVIEADFPDLVYGTDYVNLGFKAGGEGVIKVVITNLRELYTTDAKGTELDDIEMMQDVKNIQTMKLMVNISAGYPGTKEWVQFAVTAYPDKIRLVAGCTGVQAPLLYPYIPAQLPGLLAAIKGAAEYEKLVMGAYGANIPKRGADGEPILDKDGNPEMPGKYVEGQRRMGPQLVAHILMVCLILAGNLLFFLQRKQGTR